MTPAVVGRHKEIKLEAEVPPPLLKSKSAYASLEEKQLPDHFKTQTINFDRKMEDLSGMKSQQIDPQIKMEVCDERPSKIRLGKKKSKKCIYIEYSKRTHELKVIIQKVRGKKEKKKLHKTTILKKKKTERAKSKDAKTPVKSIKVKSRRNASNVKKLSVAKSKNKKPLQREQSDSVTSTKRVLLKTNTPEESESRKLRSGTKLSTVVDRKKSNPRTRSQKKKETKKRESSKTKRKVISKLVESIK